MLLSIEQEHYLLLLHNFVQFIYHDILCVSDYSELVRIFSLEDHENNLKDAVLLDLYAFTIQFCKENRFSREQTSVFFSIIKKTHEMCTGL